VPKAWPLGLKHLLYNININPLSKPI
jgi:hypothetical protein